MADEPARDIPEAQNPAIDEGVISLTVGDDPKKGVVILDFQTSVTCIGMLAQDAMNLAELLITHARRANMNQKTPLTLEMPASVRRDVDDRDDVELRDHPGTDGEVSGGLGGVGKPN